MNKVFRLLALTVCLTVLLSIGLLPASAEEVVVHDFLSKTTIKTTNGGETTGRITQGGVAMDGTGQGPFTALPQTSMDSGGRVIAYIAGTTYDSSMLLAYDIEIVTNDEYESTSFSLCTWGENVFLDGSSRIQLSEEMCAVAGISPIWEENDEGVLSPRLPGGHYQGIIDVSKYIPDGFNQFSHLAFYWKGKSLAVNRFEFVTGAEASPTIVPTTTTTEAPTTTVNGDADTAPTTAADAAAEDEGGLSTGAIVAIAVSAVIVIGGCVGVVVLLNKKKA